MTVRINNLKKIDPLVPIWYLVCREAHKQLLPQNNPYYDIHPLIIYICLAFFHIKHEWDTTKVSVYCIVNGDFVRKPKGGNATTVLKEEISNGIHQYRFKIINYDYGYPGHYYDIGFGIVSSEYFASNKYITTCYFADSKAGYVFYGSKGTREHNGGESEYGVKCKLDDIVTMIVDLENHTIRYKINDTQTTND